MSYSKIRGIWSREKKGLHIQNYANFQKSWSSSRELLNLHGIVGVDQKKSNKIKGLCLNKRRKIYENTVLAHEFWGDNQYFESLRRRTALFFGAQSSRLGGAQTVVWGARPRKAPLPRGAGLGTTCDSVLK